MLTKSKQVTLIAAGQSQAIAITGALFRFGVGLLLTFQTGITGSATVLISGDAVDARPAIVNWNNHDVLVNMTASKNSNLAYPVTAVALLVNSLVNANPGNGNGIVLSLVQVTG